MERQPDRQTEVSHLCFGYHQFNEHLDVQISKDLQSFVINVCETFFRSE